MLFRSMNIELRNAFLAALPEDHPFIREIEAFDQNLRPDHLYQGWAVINEITGLSLRRLKEEEGDYLKNAMDMGQEILENPEITKAELLDKLTDLEDYIRSLQILGNQNIERRAVEKFAIYPIDMMISDVQLWLQ